MLPIVANFLGLWLSEKSLGGSTVLLGEQIRYEFETLIVAVII